VIPTLVDTNIIVDVLKRDPKWFDWSIAALESHSSEGLCVNPSVFAELCAGRSSPEAVERSMRDLSLDYKETPRAGLFLAAQTYRRYRKADGTRKSILPDFYIDGHAEASNLKLISRDKGRFATYFPKVELICP
jgi:predicted nucleic acid-binding protein